MEKLNRLRRMKNAFAANVGIALGSLLLYPVTGSRALSGEVMHSGSDALLHGLRWGAEKFGIDQHSKKFDLFIKGSLLIPAGFLAWNAWRSGVDFFSGTQTEQSTFEMAANGVGAVAIAGANGYAYHQTSQIEEQSKASEAMHSHARADAWMSSGFAVFLGAEAIGQQQLSQFGTMVLSAAVSVHLTKDALHHKHEH